MLTTRNGNTYEFVRTNAERDENERGGIEMYDCDPLTDSVQMLFDGREWLGPKPSVEPEP